MGRSLSRALPLAVVGLFLSCPAPAEARRGGVIVVNTGHTIKHVAAVPEEFREFVESSCEPGTQIGLMHDRFGLFWLDLWTWNGRYCLYKDDSYWDLTAEDAGRLLGVEVADLPKPLLYRFPPLLCLVAVGAAIGAGVMLAKQQRAPQRNTEPYEDPRYEHALEMLRQSAQQHANLPLEPDQTAEWNTDTNSAAFRDAVTWLVQQGIPREDAERNLAALVLTLGMHPGGERAAATV
jgi:hypothetical protein